MTDESWRAKTREIFSELAPESNCGEWTEGFERLAKTIESTLLANEIEGPVSRDIAFHLSDWYEDARFMVALQLFPERFNHEEISSGLMAFLIHAPNHVAAAAKLHGFAVEDIFESPRTEE